jgi:methylmalonyl-CoA mutase
VSLWGQTRQSLDPHPALECKFADIIKDSSVTTSVQPLAGSFPFATSADWLAVVEKTLKGAGADTLISRTADGLPVRPLYSAADAGESLTFSPGGRDGGGWDIRAEVDQHEPSAANSVALQALSGGATSILIRVGKAGDLARILDGVLTDLAPVALDAGFEGVAVAEALAAVAKSAPAAPLAFHLDPLSAFAASGRSAGSIEGHVALAAAFAAGVAETYPKASLCLASGTVVHDGGGTPAWELGFTIASAVAYARALADAGLTMDAAFSGIVLGLAADAEPLTAIAKLRAARVLWARVTQACGVTTPARIEARSSGRMLTRADRWTNLVRLTSAGFAAAVGGADAVVLGAFTDAIGPADPFALRMARNTQLILMEEAHLGRVADPGGGSWAIEAQTSQLAHAAWAVFVEIEREGGAAEALQSGLVRSAVERGREALKAAIAGRALKILGVTDFRAEESPPEAEAVAPAPPSTRVEGADSACPPLAAVRLEELAQ